MPQLDKLSFATQYFWLTLFFFCLYFLTVNFFVILVFKNLKLRNIIYKIWYFFLYKFDYSEYENKNKKLVQSNFAETYALSYLNIYKIIFKNNLSYKLNSILNKNIELSFINNLISNNYVKTFMSKNIILNNELLRNLNSIDINEI